MHAKKRGAQNEVSRGPMVCRIPLVVKAGIEQPAASPAVYWSHVTNVEPYPFDASYLARLRARDHNTMSHFALYFNQLLKIKLRASGYSDSDLGDIRQDTLLRVLTAVDNSKVQNPESLRAYVYGVCEFVIREHRRKVNYNDHPDDGEEVLNVPDQRASAEEAAHHAEMRETVHWVLQKLPDKERRILVAVFIDERPKDKICEDFGITRDYLRVLVHRALLSARKLLAKGASS